MCENCGKVFSQKSHYDSHNKRKTPCGDEDYLKNIITEIVDKIIDEKISAYKKKPKFKVKPKNQLINIPSQFKLQKPILKWVGGKTQIIEDIINKFPKKMNNYYELFLGGGSVLLALLSLQKQGLVTIKNKIYVYDINHSLINFYKFVQSNPELLYEKIESYKNQYDSISQFNINIDNADDLNKNEIKTLKTKYRNPKTIEEALSSKESYYYMMRNKFNTSIKTSIENAALFIFLNKTGFRGMYRETSKGFNIPFGNYKNPTIVSKSELLYISDLIKDVEFSCCNFETSIENLKTGDFVYLDPPYFPESAKSFVSYVKDGFGINNHKKLFEQINELNKEKIKFVLSNSKVEFVTKYFKKYNIQEILAKRCINSKKPNSKAMEVIIYN